MDIPRDKHKRPLIIPPDGGTPIPYTRVTTLAATLESLFAIHQWEQRQLAVGLADRPDLLLAVTAHREDDKAVNEIVEQAKSAAKVGAAATTGQAIHRLTDYVDFGKPLPGHVPAEYRDDIEAYRSVVSHFRPIHMERFVVVDDLKVAGTPDRVFEYQGRYYIGDLKTSASLKYSFLKYAMQEAIYSRGRFYDPETGHRSDVGVEVDQNVGVIVHLPAKTGHCQAWWVNLRLAWEHVLLAYQVRQARKLSMDKVLKPIPVGALNGGK